MPYRCQIDAPHFTSILIWRVEKAVAEREEERRQIERVGEREGQRNKNKIVNREM